MPKFLNHGDQIYLIRNLNYDYFVAGYVVLSDNRFQSHFTDEEMEYLIEKHGEDFKTFIDMCKKVEVSE